MVGKEFPGLETQQTACFSLVLLGCLSIPLDSEWPEEGEKLMALTRP